MPRIPNLRVILESEPQSGSWNMAIDEALLESAITQNQATLRWYRWNEPTVSLGYFQKFAEFATDPVLSRQAVVRRLTGGGAILHDKEVTYSLTLPASQHLYSLPEELYGLVHRSLTESLLRMGFPVVFRGETLKRTDEPLLCFQRQDSHDLTLNGCKVVGSAQRRRRGAILQHGSLILRSSAIAPQIPGLLDLTTASLPQDFMQLVSAHLANQIAESWTFESLTGDETARADELRQDDSRRLNSR